MAFQMGSRLAKETRWPQERHACGSRMETRWQSKGMQAHGSQKRLDGQQKRTCLRLQWRLDGSRKHTGSRLAKETRWPRKEDACGSRMETRWHSKCKRKGLTAHRGDTIAERKNWHAHGSLVGNRWRPVEQEIACGSRRRAQSRKGSLEVTPKEA